MVPDMSVHDGPAASPAVSNGNHIIEDIYSTVSNNEPLNHNTSANLGYAVVNKVKCPTPALKDKLQYDDHVSTTMFDSSPNLGGNSSSYLFDDSSDNTSGLYVNTRL